MGKSYSEMTLQEIYDQPAVKSFNALLSGGEPVDYSAPARAADWAQLPYRRVRVKAGSRPHEGS